MVFPFVVLKDRYALNDKVDATSSEKWGSNYWEYGKYPIKIYTIDGILIYQVEIGRDNTGQAPSGGIIVPGSNASSMMATIACPITFYGGTPYTVINQEGHSGDLYNYYWTSYSRGTDGRSSPNEPSWHNAYLDGYIPLRAKSIYDPCPYLYRIPSNGTWNQFTSNPGWTGGSYLGGASWNLNTLGESWLSGLGRRNPGSSIFEYTGSYGFYYTGTTNSQTSGYGFGFNASNGVYSNYIYTRSYGQSVRCIELHSTF